MSNFSFTEMETIVRESVSTLPDGVMLSGNEQMSELGIDSITSLNVIMTVAERFNVDLDALDRITSIPATIGEFHVMMAGLVKGGAGASTADIESARGEAGCNAEPIAVGR